MTDNARIVREALERAWHLGQVYWQQADSEYLSQNRKADRTQELFRELVASTLTTLESELATTKAELARAREEDARLLLKVRDALVQTGIDEAYHLIYMFEESIAPDPFKPWEGLESRAALAPEQKGHPETSEPNPQL